jgi:hypothetical protein
MLFNVMVNGFPFFPGFSPKKSGNGESGKPRKKTGKTGNRETATTLKYTIIINHTQFIEII